MYPAFVAISLLIPFCAAAGGGPDGGLPSELRPGESKDGYNTHWEPQVYSEDVLLARSSQSPEAKPPRPYIEKEAAPVPAPNTPQKQIPVPILRGSQTNGPSPPEEEEEEEGTAKDHPTYRLAQVLIDGGQHALVLQKQNPKGGYYPDGSLWKIYQPAGAAPDAQYSFQSSAIKLSDPRISSARYLGVLDRKEAGMRGIARRYEFLSAGDVDPEEATWRWLDAVLGKACAKGFLTLDRDTKWERQFNSEIKVFGRGAINRRGERLRPRSRYTRPPPPQADLIKVVFWNHDVGLIAAPRAPDVPKTLYYISPATAPSAHSAYEYAISTPAPLIPLLPGSPPVLLGYIYDVEAFDRAARACALPAEAQDGASLSWAAQVLAQTYLVSWMSEGVPAKSTSKRV